MIHLHCELGCEKAVFERRNVGGELYCCKCGGKAIDVPDCECLKTIDLAITSATVTRDTCEYFGRHKSGD